MSTPVVSVVVPTRDRAAYLEVALRSLADQDLEEPYEVIVADDGSCDATGDVARAAGAGHLRLARLGTNAARNAGVRAAAGDLIALIDDDVQAPPAWLRAYVEGAQRHPRALAFGGPIRARLEGPAPRGCGRERPPITTLDLGSEQREVELVWSANMAFRRRALEVAGPFPEDLQGGGEEELWLARLRAAGGRVVYLPDAGLEHRRAGDDARLRALMRAAYRRGRAVRAFDRHRAVAPPLRGELRTLAGCGWHTMRYACPQGLVMAAHSLGRTVEAVRPR